MSTPGTGILFLDLETAQEFEKFSDMPADGQAAFKRKFQWRIDNGEFKTIDELYQKESALYAEFSKIVTIGIGAILVDPEKGNAPYIRLRALIGDEKAALEKLSASIEKMRPSAICAHNGEGFDFPFLCRRMMKHGVKLPSIIDPRGLKPWETSWIDSQKIWKFNDLRYNVSLVALAYMFGFPSPKETLDGSQVPAAFYAGRIVDIANYCLDDVLALIRIWLKMNYHEQIETVERVPVAV